MSAAQLGLLEPDLAHDGVVLLVELPVVKRAQRICAAQRSEHVSAKASAGMITTVGYGFARAAGRSPAASSPCTSPARGGRLEASRARRARRVRAEVCAAVPRAAHVQWKYSKSRCLPSHYGLYARRGEDASLTGSDGTFFFSDGTFSRNVFDRFDSGARLAARDVRVSVGNRGVGVAARCLPSRRGAHLWNGRSSSQMNSPSTRGITSSVSSVAAPSAAAFSATRCPAARAEPPTVAKRFSARREDDDARAAVAVTGEVVAWHVNVPHIVPRRCPFGARGVPGGPRGVV